MTLPELSAQLTDPNNRKRLIDITAILSVLAIALIVGSETLFTSFALVWAVTSQMHLAPMISYPLFAAALIVALGATGFLARMAWQSETDPANR